MKKIVATLGLVGLLVSSAQTPLPPNRSVTLAWDPSPSPEVNRYRVYWGPSSGNYTNHVEVPAVTNVSQINQATLSLPRDNKYFFAATGLANTGEESDFSNEVSYTNSETARYGKIDGFTVRPPRTIFNYTVEPGERKWFLYRSRNMVEWTKMVELPPGTNMSITIFQMFPVSFFKARYE